MLICCCWMRQGILIHIMFTGCKYSIKRKNECIYEAYKIKTFFQSTTNETYLCMQWAALIIHNGSTNTAPHQCPRNPNEGCSSSSETCHGNCPSLVGEPSIIFGIRYLELIRGCRRKGLTPHSLNKRKFILNYILTLYWCISQAI